METRENRTRSAAESLFAELAALREHATDDALFAAHATYAIAEALYEAQIAVMLDVHERRNDDDASNEAAPPGFRVNADGAVAFG